MNIKYLLSGLFLLFVSHVSAQTSDYATDKLEFLNIRNGDVIMGKKLPPPDVVGSYYYNDNWYPSTIISATGKTFKDLKAKYNIEDNSLDISDPQSKKEFYVDGSRVREFTLLDQRFVNIDVMKINTSGNSGGFYEVIYGGEKMSLLKKHFCKTLKPTYKEGLDMGTRDYRIVRDQKLFWIQNEVLTEVPSRKKDFYGSFGEKAADVMAYVKQNNLTYGKEADMTRIMAYCDSL